MKGDLKKNIWLAIAGFQLILVVLGAASVDLTDTGRIGRALEYYSSLSGADTGYGFFAPGISGQLRARFELIDSGGTAVPVEMESPHSHESAIRVGNIIDQFWEEDESENDRVHRSLVASLAGKILGRHPEAHRVRVVLEKFTPVTMADLEKENARSGKSFTKAASSTPPQHAWGYSHEEAAFPSGGFFLQTRVSQTDGGVAYRRGSGSSLSGFSRSFRAR